MQKLALLSLLSISILSCKQALVDENNKLPSPLQVEYSVATTSTGDKLCFGGYGSSMAYDSKDGSFYLLTDRGPNVDWHTDESKMFPFPEFSPMIGKFRVSGDSLLLEKAIALKLSDGTPFLGLPNREGDGVTGGVAYDIKGNIITSCYRGIDSEGLALSSDGTFWVSDEYAPFIMQFDADGLLMREFSPGHGLPSHFSKRRPNRGMEGLTISADGERLYGIMQSPLYLPDERTKNESHNIRILELEIASGKTREFIYPLESAKLGVSEITFVNDTTLMVLERDSKHATDNFLPFKRIFKIGIASATDVSNMEIEMMSAKELDEHKIATVTKELAVDIIDQLPKYRHDKVEGMVIYDEGVVAIVNDDDFSAEETKEGGFKPKLDAHGDVDHAVVHFLHTK